VKLTKQQLKQVIQEEIEKATLLEALTPLGGLSAFQIQQELRAVSSDMWAYWGHEQLSAALEIVKQERDELQREYKQGPAGVYTPDWFDQYVHPLNSLISQIEDARIDAPDSPENLYELTDDDKFYYDDEIEMIKHERAAGTERSDIIDILEEYFDVEEKVLGPLVDYVIEEWG
jgi:hypothetical protein